jgi:hypothetical protein
MLKRARGARPYYFDNPDIDRLMTIVLSVAEELSVTRERLDTVERLLEASGTISRQEVDDYTPEESADEEREALRVQNIQRILRIVIEEPQALAESAAAKGAYENVIREVS